MRLGTTASVVGVNGCRGGWIAACFDRKDLRYFCAFFPGVEELWRSLGPGGAMFYIDMPIGLPCIKATDRACDAQARSFLGRYHARAFPTPLRETLIETDYAKANAFQKQFSGKGLSRQVWHIRTKILELDALLRADEGAVQRFCESHPEMVFARWNGGRALSESKKSEGGHLKRSQLVMERLGQEHDLNAIMDETLDQFGVKVMSRDDLLDALALCLAAKESVLLGARQSFSSEDQAYDGQGLPMRIHY